MRTKGAKDYSPDEIKIIREGMRSGRTKKEMAKELGRSTLYDICCRLRALGINDVKYKIHKRWTHEDDEIIERIMSQPGRLIKQYVADIMAATGHPYSAVVKRLRERKNN